MPEMVKRKKKLIDVLYENNSFYGLGKGEVEEVKEVETFKIPEDFIKSNYPYPYIIDVDEPYTFPPIIDVFPSYKEKVKVVTIDNDDLVSKMFEAYFRAQAIKFKYLFS